LALRKIGQSAGGADDAAVSIVLERSEDRQETGRKVKRHTAGSRYVKCCDPYSL